MFHQSTGIPFIHVLSKAATWVFLKQTLATKPKAFIVQSFTETLLTPNSYSPQSPQCFSLTILLSSLPSCERASVALHLSTERYTRGSSGLKDCPNSVSVRRSWRLQLDFYTQVWNFILSTKTTVLSPFFYLSFSAYQCVLSPSKSFS